jgi:hypothetical protein
MMRHGAFLFLIGLVTGLQQRRFTNMRMALSAHLEGVMKTHSPLVAGSPARPTVNRLLDG